MILTTAVKESMIRKHDRMPMILEEGQVKYWVFRENKAEEMLRRVQGVLKKRMKYELQSSSLRCPGNSTRMAPEYLRRR